MSGINRPVAAAERTGGAAVVVGGGIAGLAAAAALGGAGWRVTVLEQAPVFWEAGAGLTLTPNGLRALAGLGIEGAVRDAGWALRPDGVMGSHGERLVRFSSKVRAMPVVGIHRRSLHGVLVDAASAVVDLRPGCRVLGMDIGAPGGRPARVRWREGGADHVMAADLLVGADGVNSTVRQRVAPAVDVRPSGFAAWRAVVPDVGSGPDWTAWWGDGAEFGAQRIGPDRVSWHCLFRVDAAARLDEGGRGLDEFIAGWPSQVLDLVSRSDPERILRHDISVARGEFRSFVAGRTVLVGDAAHPILPTLSQGANLALEDGVTLGHLVRGASVDAALRSHDAVRAPRARRVAKSARALSWIGAGCPRGLGQTVRNRILERLPAQAVERYISGITEWDVPVG